MGAVSVVVECGFTCRLSLSVRVFYLHHVYLCSLLADSKRDITAEVAKSVDELGIPGSLLVPEEIGRNGDESDPGLMLAFD